MGEHAMGLKSTLTKIFPVLIGILPLFMPHFSSFLRRWVDFEAKIRGKLNWRFQMAIGNGDMPDWIQKHNDQKAEQARKAAVAEEQRQAARASVQASGPDFWTRLVDRIIVNVRALPGLAGEELVGSVSPSTGAPEYACHIQVNRQSVRFDPELSKMNLWYTPGGTRIRCWYQDQPLSDFTLAVHGDEVAASVNGGIYNAEKLADHIVEWMADRVKASRSRRAS